MVNPEATHLSQVEYRENPADIVRPEAGMRLDVADVAAIEQSLLAIGQQEGRLAERGEELRHAFTGILPHEGHGGRLLSVGLVNAPNTLSGCQYKVYDADTASDEPGSFNEELIPDDDEHRTNDRGLIQTITHPRLGNIDVSPRSAVVHPKVRNHRFDEPAPRGTKAVAIEDALRPSTEDDWRKMAIRELDLDRPDVAPNYPMLGGEHHHRSHLRRAVENSLAPLRDAILSPASTAADREHLVRLGHNIIDATEQDYKSAATGPNSPHYRELNPEAAAFMAHAEAGVRSEKASDADKQQTQSRGLMGRTVLKSVVDRREAEKAAVAKNIFDQEIRTAQQKGAAEYQRSLPQRLR